MGAAGALLALMAPSPAAFGQGITDLTVSKNAANRADAASSNISPGLTSYSEVRSVVAAESSSPSAFRTRYSFFTGFDADNPGGGTLVLPPGLYRADYGIAFNVTAPGAYDLLVTTRLSAGFTLEDDSTLGNAALMTGVSGSQSGGTLSGSLELADPPDLGAGDGGAYSVDETSPVATINGASNGSPVAHRLDFSWLYRCFPASTVFDADACGIRGGLSANVAGLASVGSYPGVPARNADDDGHIVEVTLISYCGDGVVQADRGETCDDGAANGGLSCCAINCTTAPSGTLCREPISPCDVADTCNGVDATCANGVGTAGITCRASAGACDQVEICDGVGDSCPEDLPMPEGTDCDDGAFCNGVRMCSGFVCDVADDPCPTSNCDEASRACFVACPLLPRLCGSAAKNSLLLKNQTDDTKDKLVWKWSNGAATSLTEFGDPLVATSYSLCFYAGATPTLIGELGVPAGGGRWATLGSKGYKYSDLSAITGGVSTIILKSGADGKSKALVKGKGAALPDFDGLVPLPASDLPLIVQLRNSDSDLCWAGAFANPKQSGQFNGRAAP